MHYGKQTSQHQQSSRLALSGGGRSPALGKERCGSSSGRHSVKCSASVYIRETCLLVPPAE
jgi:hypothetical protein